MPESDPRNKNPATDRLDHLLGRQTEMDPIVSKAFADGSTETNRYAERYPKEMPSSLVDGLGTVAGDGSYAADADCGSGDYFGNSSTIKFVTQVERILASAGDLNQTSFDSLDTRATSIRPVIA